MSIFDKYMKNVNADEIAKSQAEINENAQGSTNYPEVPVGKYEVKIEKLEAKLSSSKNPMISIWFKILNGSFKDSYIFYNGVYHEDWMRHRVTKFLAELIDDEGAMPEINLILKTADIDTVNNFVMDLHEEVDGKFEYLLDYGQKKGYNTYNIEEVYEV